MASNYNIPTSNENGTSQYFNTNQCFSFNSHMPGSQALVQLSSQPCSEVTIWNHADQSVLIFVGPGDNAAINVTGEFAKYSDAARGVLLLKSTADHLHEITIRGLTNSDQVSAKKAANGSAGSMIYYRTQFFSNNPSK